MLLGIAAELSAPPSSPTSYREITMFAKMVRGYDVVALSPAEMASAYDKWFRIFGLWDYVDDIIPREQVGEDLVVEIECVPHGRLTAHNIVQVMAAI